MSEDKIGDILYSLASENFHKPIGLLLSIVILFFTELSLLALVKDVLSLSNTIASLVFISISSLAMSFVWYRHTYYIRRRKKDKIGLIFAVFSEESADEKLFINDFVNPFKNKVVEMNLPFDIIQLKKHHAEKIKNMNDASEYLKKTNSQFCLYGCVKKRKKTDTGNQFIFSLNGVVVHRPVQEISKILLQREFSEILPNELAIEESMQFQGFQFRTEQAVVALDYITGRAALLSGDSKTAIELHEKLLADNSLSKIVNSNTLKTLLSIEYDCEAANNMISGNTLQFKNNINKSLRLNHTNYGALLKKAISELNDGNPKSAQITVGQAERYAPPGAYHWLYSKAFLHFYLQEYPEAIKACDKLKRKSYSGEDITIAEVIKFNEDILKTNDIPQLRYWLGFVYLNKQNNYSAADLEFQRFIDSATDKMSELVTRAKGYLSLTKQEIKYQ